ncbi:hypothetical protein OSTOST_15088 [Ostertagia ostertagi]
MDNLAEPSPKDIEDFEGYSSRAEDAISMAFDYTLQLRARIQVFHSYDRRIVIGCSCSDQFSDQGTQHIAYAKGEAKSISPGLYANFYEFYEDSQVFLHNHWMDVKCTDGRCLQVTWTNSLCFELYMKEKAPTASCLENSLTLTMDGIERQLETAAIIRSTGRI